MKAKKMFENKTQILTTSVLLSLLIIIGGFSYLKYEKHSIRISAESQLKSIASLKVLLIENWNNERLKDANSFMQNEFFADEFERWLSNRRNFLETEILKKRLSLINNDSSYSNVFITDTKGELQLSLETEYSRVDSVTACYVRKAVKKDEVIMTDFYKCEGGKICLDYISPIKGKGNRALGAVVFRVNADKYLNRIIEDWPVPSKTSETLIVRREGDSVVVFLNELRQQRNAALNLKISLKRKNIAAVQAALGGRGIFVGRDYVGKKILAYIAPISGTNWKMIVKTNESEIYSELPVKEGVVIGFTIFLIVTFLVGLMWIYHYRQRNLYRQLLIKERELTEYHKEFKTILYSIGDGVITVDEEGKVKQMNYVAEELTGWKESEAIGEPLEAIFKIVNGISKKAVENPVKKVLREGAIVGLANHTLLISKNGQETPIADSGAPIRNESGEVEGVVLIFRDKTEEYKAERLIRQSETRLKRAELASKTGNWELYLDTKKMIASEGAAKIYGIKGEEFDYEDVKRVPLPEYRNKLDLALKNLIEKDEPYDVEFKIKAIDSGEIKDIHSVSFYDKDKRILFGVIQDITDRKKAEAAVAESEEKMRAIVEGTPYLFFYTQDSDGNITYISPSVEKITGYTVEQWIGQKHWFVTNSEVNKIAKEKTRLHLNGVFDKESILIEIKHANGKNIFLEAIESPIIKNNLVVGIQGVARDITELKKLEQERFQLLNIIEDSTNEIYVFDSFTLKFEYVNKGALSNTGYSLEEIYNMTPVNIKPEFTEETFRKKLEPLEKGEKNKLLFETVHQRKDGSIYPVEIHLQLHKFENKSVFFAIINDITERKKIEQKLRESEINFRLIFEKSPLGIYIANSDGEMIDVNQALLNILGSPSKEATKQINVLSFPLLIQAGYSDKFKECIQKNEVVYYEMEYTSKWGKNSVLASYLVPLMDEKGKVLKVYTLMDDITERKKAEEQLRQSEERFRTTLYSIGDGVITTDNKGLTFQINPVAEHLTGWSEADAKNEPLEKIFRIINEETRNTVESPVEKVLREGKIVGLANHTLLISKDGKETPIADSGAPIIGSNGKIEGVVLVFRDQSKERAAQKAMMESLNEKEILLKEVHHRVKNNFQQIIGLISLQTENIEDEKVLGLFNDLQTRLRTMSLIHELMYSTNSFSNLDIRDYIERLTGYLIKTYSASSLIKVNFILESHNLSMDTIIPCGLILNEMITNSLKYAFPNEANGEINISFYKKDGQYCLSYSDNGIGIKNKINIEDINTLGMRLIKLLTMQLRGTLNIEQPKNGLIYTITFAGVN